MAVNKELMSLLLPLQIECLFDSISEVFVKVDEDLINHLVRSI